MAQIFVSHSSRDTDLVDYFSRLAARSQVRLVFEEIEKLVLSSISAERIRRDIAASQALFLLLSRHVQTIPHTRDWVLWESGIAHNKDIWAFEPLRDAGFVSVVTPYLRHYVLFEPSDLHFPYLANVVESYDDSQMLGTVLATTGIGAAFGGKGALIGAIAGAALADKSGKRPSGLQVTCPNCQSSYAAHLPQGTTAFRCPVCNTTLVIPGGVGTAG